MTSKKRFSSLPKAFLALALAGVVAFAPSVAEARGGPHQGNHRHGTPAAECAPHHGHFHGGGTHHGHHAPPPPPPQVVHHHSDNSGAIVGTAVCGVILGTVLGLACAD